MAKAAVEKTAVPKGTKTSEVILGTAATKLGSGIKALSEMVLEIAKLEEIVSENTLIISDQEEKIATKALELRNAIAQNKIELQQAYESDKEAFVNAWLVENGLETIATVDKEEMLAKLAEATTNTEKEVRKEVAIVSNTLTSKHESAMREKQLEFRATEAQNTAMLAQKEEKIKFLEEQVAAWKKALEDEREAGVKRAQAATVQQTFTGSSGK